jgi:enoyl-CoA hydratase
MGHEALRYEQADHVVTLTYDRPQQHNAINRVMNRELHDAWQRFRDDDEAFVLVLVITGAGETTFCAGWGLDDAADLDELGDYDDFRVHLHNSPGECGYTRKVDIFKPVIAAVNGYAFAAGLETALLADIRIAAENAEFGALERRWNIVGGDGMTVRLPLVVGFAKAMELIITGRRIDVTEARAIGLVNEIVPRGTALRRAQELAHEISALPQGAIRSDRARGRRRRDRRRVANRRRLADDAALPLRIPGRRGDRAIPSRTRRAPGGATPDRPDPRQRSARIRLLLPVPADRHRAPLRVARPHTRGQQDRGDHLFCRQQCVSPLRTPPHPAQQGRMRPERRRVVTVVSVVLLATSGVTAPPQGPPTCSWQLAHDQVV